MGELVCSCPGAPDLHPKVHLEGCAMVTGVPVGTLQTSITPGTVHFPAGEVLLSSPEPPLARVLRARLDDRKVVQVHLLDGSILVGTVVEVCDDGSTATVDDGSSDLYDFDVSSVCVVQTRRPKA